MKSAKEMFEELGYFQDIETSDEVIVYSKDILDKDTFGYIYSEEILIDKKSRCIHYDNVRDTREVNKAVVKLCEELNWK